MENEIQLGKNGNEGRDVCLWAEIGKYGPR